MNTTLKLTGELDIVVTDSRTGIVKETRHEKNLVVIAGLGFITSRMIGSGAGVMSHMGLGIVNTAQAGGNTTLASEIGTRGTVTAAQSMKTVANDTVQYQSVFAAGTPLAGSNVITEAGIFNAASGGTMLCRTTFASITKGPDDAVTITWRVSVAA